MVADDVSVVIEPYQLSNSDLVEETLQSLGASAINLEVAPLMMASLLQTDSGESTLSLVVHHAIADFWSVRLLIDSLASGYEQILMEEKPDLISPDVSFSDLTIWQEEYLASDYASKQMDWWKEKLAGSPGIITLPYDRQRPREPTYSAGRVTSQIDSSILSRIEEISRSSGCSLQSILLSGLAYILSVFSSQTDVIIGVPTAGRELGESQSVIGYFVNSVPVRLEVDKEDSWERFVNATAKEMIGVMKNASIPFQDIVRVAGPRGNAGNVNPLFQVMFQYLPDVNSLSGTMGLVEYTCRQAPVPESAKFDLTINMYSSGLLDVVYMEEIFNQSTIKTMMNAFETVLMELPSRFDTSMQHLPLVRQEDVGGVVSSYSMGMVNVEHLNQPLIHESIEKIAMDNPNRIAIIDENGAEITYSALNVKAEYIAKLISIRGVPRNSPILVLLERSFDLIATLLATWKAGCCFVPLDPDFPDARLSMYAEDSASELLISKSTFSQRASTISSAQCVFLDEAGGCEECGDIQLQPCKPKDLAYIEFTSGSSGRPKGVPIDQRSLSIYCHNVLQRLDLSDKTTSLFLTSINFDAYVRQTWTPLVTGGKVVVARNDYHTDPDYIMELANKHCVTYMHAVPSLMVEYLKSENALEGLNAMQVLGTGGEAMNPRMLSLMDELDQKRRDKGIERSILLYNSYGPTETTVSCTCHVDLKLGDRITIGRPDFNMAAMVLDPNSKLLLPPGAPGELVISGPRLSSGYLGGGTAEATKKAFTTNPYYIHMQDKIPEHPEIFNRAYHTGDLVRWTSDANLEFLGRVDRQVKVDGVRVELGEIESVILRHPMVEKVVVTGVPHPILKAIKLVAYIAPEDVDTKEVLEICESSLARSMVPTAIVTMASLPLNPSGKVDMKALPEPQFGVDEESRYEPPITEAEKTIQDIWMDVLGIEEPISVTINFFEIGGSSLNAGMISAKLRKAFDKEDIGNDLIFKEKTIRNIASAIEGPSAALKWRRHATRNKLGQATRKFLDIKDLSERQQEFAARKNASELDFGLKPAAMGRTNFKSPSWMFEFIFLLIGLLASVINVLIPGLTIILSAVCQALPTAKSIWWVLLIAPGLYLGILALAFLFTVGLKWLMFPRRMKPGFYPAHGMYYIRWLAYHSVYRRVSLFLFPHIGRTEIWNVWLRMLGAKIGKGARIDTVHIYEPDLVYIGDNVVIEEEVHVSSSIVSPAGLISPKDPSLVLSTIIIEDNSKVLRKSVVQAGARIPKNCILRPYGTNHSVGSVLNASDPKYDKFDVESHMSTWSFILARLTVTMLNMLSLYPGTMLAYSVIAWCYSIRPVDFLHWIYLLCVNGPPPGVNTVARFTLLPIALIAFGVFILAPCTIFSQFVIIAIWKKAMVGKFSEGRRLSTQLEFFSYLVLKELWRMPYWIIFERQMHSLFFTNPMYRFLGCNVGVDCLVCGISEPEAVYLGHKSDAGGISGFHSINKEGVVAPVHIGDGASYGHSSFYPGCSIGAFSIVGNETDVPANMKLEEGFNLQGDLIFPGGVQQHYVDDIDKDVENVDPNKDDSLQNVLRTPRFDCFAPEAVNVSFKLVAGIIFRSLRMVLLFLTSESLNLVFAFGPLSLVFTTLFRELHWHYNWSIAEAILGAATTVLPAMLLGLFFCVIWLRLQVILLRGESVWRREKVSVSQLQCRLLMAAVFRLLIVADSFRGTRLYTFFLRLAGWRIGKGSIIFGVPNVEIPLLEAGDIIMESDAKIATHYIQSGEFFNKPLNVGSGAWFQTRCRVLGANMIGENARILPGTMVMPNEEIQQNMIWGGVPASPLSSTVSGDDEKGIEEKLSNTVKSFKRCDTLQAWYTMEYA